MGGSGSCCRMMSIVLRSKLLLSYQKLISMWKDLESQRNGVCYHRKMKKLWLLVLLNESNLSSGCFNLYFLVVVMNGVK